MNSEKILEVNNLSISFQREGSVLEAVKNISFSVQQGSCVALVGESGSGKTVSALSILKLLPYPQAFHPNGEIFFQGENLLNHREKKISTIRGNEISMIFQEPMTSLNPLHDVKKQIAEVMMVHHKILYKEIPDKVFELLNLVGLKKIADRKHCYPHEMSGGEQQRIMIAMALANSPKLLIADEPTTALDVTIQQQILALLKKIRVLFNMSILFITHDLGIVTQFSDYLYVMKNGQIVEEGETTKVFENPTHNYTISLIKANNLPRKTSIELTNKIDVNIKEVGVKFPLPSSLFSLRRKYLHVLNDINLKIPAGSTLGIVGESGAGKTTLIKAVLALVDFQGDIVMLDKNLRKLSRKDLKKFKVNIGLVAQDPFSSLSPKMKVSEIVTEMLDIHYPNMSKTEKHNLLLNAMEEVELEPEHINRFPFEFSGGQRQRLAIARAIIHQPNIIILDEPTSALDKTLQDNILNLLQNLQKKKSLTFIFVSHDLNVIASVSDQILVLKEGKVVEFGLANDILNNPTQKYTKKLFETSTFTSPPSNLSSSITPQ